MARPQGDSSVDDSMVWKSIAEQAAYGRFSEILDRLKKLGLTDAHRALQTLLRRRREDGKWDLGVLQDFVTTYELEFSQEDSTYEEGLQLLKRILGETFDVKRRKGRLMDPKEAAWNPDRLAHTNTSLALVMDLFKQTRVLEIQVLLAAMGHIIRFQMKGGFVSQLIHFWASPSVKRKADRNAIVEDYLTLKTKGSDGKADTRHIRNAFAHAHFEFVGSRTVHLWDESNGVRTFDAHYDVLDLVQFFNMFEKKLALAEIHISMLLALNDLYGDYKSEWKSFQR